MRFAQFRDISGVSQESIEDDAHFKLLDYAYIGARYDPKYSISDADLGILAPCVRTLLDRTKAVCEAELGRIKL